MNQEEKARKRAEMIVKVRSGLMTATDAAKELGISRKTYYVWEKRALSAMVEALTDAPAGRPSDPVDSEKENLKGQLMGKEQELALLKTRMKIREIMAEGTEPGNRAENPPKKKEE